MAKKVYTCQTCGALAEEPGHLCNPNADPMTCAFVARRRPMPSIIARASWKTSSMSAANVAAWPLPRICSANPPRCQTPKSRYFADGRSLLGKEGPDREKEKGHGSPCPFLFTGGRSDQVW